MASLDGETHSEVRDGLLNRKCVYLVVLGDIGHSPRMRYHALSLTDRGYFVQIFSFCEATTPDDLEQNPYIWIKPIKQPPKFLQDLPKSLSLPLKFIWLTFVLTWAFLLSLIADRFYPDIIFVQNPPAIPTLGFCWLMSKVYRCPFIVDWHNYGFTIMSLTTSRQNPLLALAEKFENYFGAKADYSITVTRAMAQDLKDRLGVQAITLYDRPPHIFKSLTFDERFTFLTELSEKFPLLSRVVHGGQLGSGRPGILISCTSWTEDEDFGVLLEALREYETEFEKPDGDSLSELIVFITGKGPKKSFYSSLIDSLHFQHVNIFLPWLSQREYPKILACADLGVSLHFSSSGLDLPMKVVDMYGSGLPVAAMHFQCISELVHHGQNGLVFRSSSELSRHLQQWFKISSIPDPRYSLFRQNIKKFQSLRWEENWRNELGNIFSSPVRQ